MFCGHWSYKMSLLKEKLAICYTLCGPSYRNTAIRKLTEFWPDDPNIYYFVITDDKSYFDNVPRQNLVVKELRDFYEQYPEIEQYEQFLHGGDDIEDYGRRFVEADYKFPFPVMRFHLKLAEELGILNVAMLGTDSDLRLDILDPTRPGGYDVLGSKNTIHNSVSWWTVALSEDEPSRVVAQIIKDKYGLESKNPDKIWIYDEAARFYIFKNVKYMMKLFDMWHYVIGVLYETKEIQRMFRGWVIIHDEFTLGVIYDIIGINKPPDMLPLFTTRHDPVNERPWRYLFD